ncbi:MAG: hypothetical protein ACTHK7_21970 [Aureliella sp.]
MTRPDARALLIDSSLLAGAILAVGCLTLIGYRMTGRACDRTSVAVATLMVEMAMVPPLWIEFWIGRVVAAPVVTVMWRLGILLPAALWSTHQLEPARNCVQVTLLACYLMALPLESWLLIRQPRH